MFNLKNYRRAKELYRDLYKNDLNNIKNKYHFGVSLIYSFEEADGIKILESLTKEKSLPLELSFHLGRAYHLSNRYNKAITMYNKYINSANAKTELIEIANRNIEMCNNAILLVKNPINIEFENLGSRINSKWIEYLPIITPKENLLIYSTRRQGITGRVYDLEGYFTADIYVSKYKYGKWSKARSIGPPNSYGNEETAGISENGNYIIYYVNNPHSKNNLQLSKKVKSSFRKAFKIDSEKINKKGSVQLSATISNNKDYLIFSSNRADGYGDNDLYICHKLPTGEWATPINMGSIINTVYDECYPYLTDNGYCLYFSSKGHNSMGGYDVFKSEFNLSKKEWSKPVNIGYPINTPYDNKGISFVENKKYAYVSTHRKDSKGDLDIYKVNFLDKDPLFSIIKGYVLNVDSAILGIPLTMEVFNKKSSQLYGIYDVNKEKGNFIMILPPGIYEINIDVPDSGLLKKQLIVEGRNKYKKEINQNIEISFDIIPEEQ